MQLNLNLILVKDKYVKNQYPSKTHEVQYLLIETIIVNNLLHEQEEIVY
jgi:hypothetical protein